MSYGPGIPKRIKMATHKLTLYLFIVTALFIGGTDAHAQGSVFGSVTKSDLQSPPNPDVVFFGFINNTDDELRVSSSIGAGYDNGNWFDDFQNYISKSAGMPYDYYFFDLVTAEGVQLSSVIPNNSFQQENVQLLPLSWPAPATSITVTKMSSTSIQIDWVAVPGFSYHIYRRSSTSQGSFFRIDDPSGNLGVSGIIGNQFLDNNAMATSDYDYVILTATSGGLFSPPSQIVTSTSPVSCCVGITGNIDNDPNDETDITDLTVLIDHLFISFVALPCPAEGNVDGDTLGAVDITDLTVLIDHLFINFTSLSACQ